MHIFREISCLQLHCHRRCSLRTSHPHSIHFTPVIQQRPHSRAPLLILALQNLTWASRRLSNSTNTRSRYISLFLAYFVRILSSWILCTLGATDSVPSGRQRAYLKRNFNTWATTGANCPTPPWTSAWRHSLDSDSCTFFSSLIVVLYTYRIPSSLHTCTVEGRCCSG